MVVKNGLLLGFLVGGPGVGVQECLHGLQKGVALVCGYLTRAATVLVYYGEKCLSSVCMMDEV